jgi:hypothetical protein
MTISPIDEHLLRRIPQFSLAGLRFFEAKKTNCPKAKIVS